MQTATEDIMREADELEKGRDLLILSVDLFLPGSFGIQG